MSGGFTLWRGDNRRFDWGRLTFDHNIVTLECARRKGVVEADPTSPFVEVYFADDWLVAIGAASGRILLGHDNATIRSCGEVPRYLSPNGYGAAVHAARFREVPRMPAVVLAWELGVALLDRAEGLQWQFKHGDLNQRVLSVGPDTIELVGASVRYAISLSDGTAVGRDVQRPLSEGNNLETQ